MSISLHSNAKILCTRFYHQYNQNLPSPLLFQLPDHLHFPPNYRLSAVVDHKRSSIVYCNKDGDSAFSDRGDAFTCVMKFGGSSVALAERMREVANLIQCFPEENPIIVLSAMGKTSNNLICAGEKAVSCGFTNMSEIEELSLIKDVHLRIVNELGIGVSVITEQLDELELLLNGIARLKELTPRTRDKLVSFGECMSTRVFAAYLNSIGIKAQQYDAFDIGFVTTDDFTNADILDATYPAVAAKLHADWISNKAIPVVTGFLGRDASLVR
ncbi:aspartokinase 1, chloroplastic-like isoform X2 [Salvia splendens]|uniref:aspartokinase 1, chloroplastic-like isoform X2 n=1 Tax=Salvia splendens TaxID=180675 RepID=UPI001C26FC8F|nr:aspartokinase 1, chloroplastic-like isoform X2 [Salvia splendens]